jgi:hypothetical protein
MTPGRVMDRHREMMDQFQWTENFGPAWNMLVNSLYRYGISASLSIRGKAGPACRMGMVIPFVLMLRHLSYRMTLALCRYTALSAGLISDTRVGDKLCSARRYSTMITRRTRCYGARGTVSLQGGRHIRGNHLGPLTALPDVKPRCTWYLERVLLFMV